MSFEPPYAYMNADKLAEMLKVRHEQQHNVAVVDVRGTYLVAWHKS